MPDAGGRRRSGARFSSAPGLRNGEAATKEDHERTCIRNHQSVECLQLQVDPDAFGRTKGAAKPMSTPILTVAPAGTWNLDPIHSRVDFAVSYLAGTFRGEDHESRPDRLRSRLEQPPPEW